MMENNQEGQCHRAYIVNLRHVAKIENRTSGIALVMQYGDETVLVSKQYSAEVKKRIKNPSSAVLLRDKKNDDC